eukprot:m.7376 g.7376  ORF g.7376 m.7376 type:complete len:59 (-) comp5241_c0_seq1:27-203(-)
MTYMRVVAMPHLLKAKLYHSDIALDNTLKHHIALVCTHTHLSKVFPRQCNGQIHGHEM